MTTRQSFRLVSRAAGAAALLVATPVLAGACPVCFGASDSPLAAGMNAGIFVLLGVTAAVLSGAALTAWSIARRARAVDAAAAAPASAGRVPAAVRSGDRTVVAGGAPSPAGSAVPAGKGA